MRALQDGRTRWIVLAGVCVGLGFETKMGAALLVVPAIVAAWLWIAPRGRLAALRQLLAGGAAMVVVGGAWPLLMMLTPASSRPWISGTSDNSILSLILNYNGLGRLDGQAGGPQNMGGGGPGGGTTFGGATGPLRLFNEGLGGQAGWLLGFALVAIVALAVGHAPAARGRPHRLADRRRRHVPHHRRRLQLRPGDLPPLLRRRSSRPSRRCSWAPGSGWFLSRHRAAGLVAAAALAAGVATELLVLHKLPGQLTWLPAVLLVAGAVTAVALVAVRGPPARRRPRRRARAAAARPRELGRADARPRDHQGTFPAGGPAQVGFGGGPGRGGPGGGFGAAPAPARAGRGTAAQLGAGTAGGPPGAAHRAAGRRRRPGGGTGGGGGVRRRQRRAEPGRGLRQASTAAAPSPSPASPARPRRSSSRAPTSPASAASPAARARSPRRGWRTPSAAGACGQHPPARSP